MKKIFRGGLLTAVLLIAVLIFAQKARAENWQLVHHEIGMLFDDYVYLDWERFRAEGPLAVFALRLSSFKNSRQAYEEIGVSFNCREKTVTVLNHISYNENFTGADYRIGFPVNIRAMSPARQDMWQAIIPQICMP